MQVKVEKYTDVELLRRANSFTTNKDSHMTLATAYRLGHSTIRSQRFWIELKDIPLFVASQLVRSHVGMQCYQLSKRTDRGGADFQKVCSSINVALAEADIALADGDKDEVQRNIDIACKAVDNLPQEFDRYAPTNLAIDCNAEALMNMAHKRLCSKASKETQAVVEAIKLEVRKVDPDLADHMVPMCWYRGGICSENKPCGRNSGAECANYMLQFV